MTNKITEKIIEPTKVVVGSTFKLKVKVIRYLTYKEIKDHTVEELKKYTLSQLKGED